MARGRQIAEVLLDDIIQVGPTGPHPESQGRIRRQEGASPGTTLLCFYCEGSSQSYQTHSLHSSFIFTLPIRDVWWSGGGMVPITFSQQGIGVGEETYILKGIFVLVLC